MTSGGKKNVSPPTVYKSLIVSTQYQHWTDRRREIPYQYRVSVMLRRNKNAVLSVRTSYSVQNFKIQFNFGDLHSSSTLLVSVKNKIKYCLLSSMTVIVLLLAQSLGIKTLVLAWLTG